MDEQTKSTVLKNFASTVRQVAAPGIDAQRLTMALGVVLDNTQVGELVHLAPLLEYIVNEMKAPETSAVELAVILKSREQKIGVTFSVPDKVNYLGQEAISRILAAFTAKTEKTTSWEKPSAEIEKQAAAAPPPAPAPGFVPKKKTKKHAADPADYSRQLAGMLGISVVLCIAFWVYRQETIEPGPEDVPVTAISGGLSCLNIQRSGGNLFCEISKADWQKGPLEALEAKADITKTALKARKIYVRVTGGKIEIFR